MISRAEVDLSVARGVDSPIRVQINSPFWLRFQVVPGTVNVRVGSKTADRLPVTSPFTMKFCADSPRDIFIDNDAASGSLVILYGDSAVELDDFLAESGSGDWTPTAIVVPAADNTLRNLLTPDYADANQAGATANAAYAVLAATQRRVWRIGIAGSAADGYTIREAHNIVPLLDYLFAPGGVVRPKTFVPSLRWETEVQGEIVLTAGELMLAVGYLNRVVGPEAYGVGFFCAPARTGNNRWYAGVIDYSGGAVGNKPLPADQILFQDLGILATDMHTLAMEIGQSGGVPFIKWEIDGVTVYQHTGLLPAWWDTLATGLGFGFKAQHATLADTAFLHMVQYRLFAGL